MLLDRLDLSPGELVERTGWEIKPEGACKDDMCVPLRTAVARPDGAISVEALASQLDMPLARDEKHGLWALGTRAGGRVLSSEVLDPIVLDDFQGRAFDVATLRGRKVLLISWASW